MTSEPQKETIVHKGDRFAHVVIVYLVSLLLALPLFIILLPYVPQLVLPIGEGIRVDHFITFVLIMGAFIILVRKFQTVVYTGLITGMVVLTLTGLLRRALAFVAPIGRSNPIGGPQIGPVP